MAAKEKKKKIGKDKLQSIINRCKTIEERDLDPFLLDIDEVIEVIQEYFPEWESPGELVLDAEAVHNLASIIKRQSDWVKHRSNSLYVEPFLFEDRIRKLNNNEIVSLFLKAWNPIVELEQISLHSLKRALEYWQDLLPLAQRWLQTESVKSETGLTTREELIDQRILTDQFFSKELEDLWEDLKRRIGKEGKMSYWDFIGTDSFFETIKRAYMTSFLITYGYANLEIHRLEEAIFIKPVLHPTPHLRKDQATSIPISISVEDWREWREINKD